MSLVQPARPVREARIPAAPGPVHGADLSSSRCETEPPLHGSPLAAGSAIPVVRSRFSAGSTQIKGVIEAAGINIVVALAHCRPDLGDYVTGYFFLNRLN